MDKIYIKPLDDPDAFINIDDIEIIPIIIGKSGIYFKNITRISGVDYIWYDNECKKIYIWGQIDNTKKALELLNTHINKVKIKNAEN